MIRPKITVVVTGGTIDALGRDRLDLSAYQETGDHLTAMQLLARIPEVAEFAAIHLEDPPRVLGPRVSLDDVMAFTCKLQEYLDDPATAGLVVTRGTNTLEEFAYLAHLTLTTNKPVVFVGAMRPASGLGTDGDLNLLRAVQVAADEGAHGQGVLVVLNDRIYSARDVTKTATYRVDAFAGRDLGPLGFADADGRVVLYHSHMRGHTGATRFTADEAPLPRVDILVSYVGADGLLVDAAVAAGARGIVSAGMGAGFPTAKEMDALRRAQAGETVVAISSRVGSGRVTARPAVRQEGFIATDNLVPWKARILLALCLRHEMSIDAIQETFDSH